MAQADSRSLEAELEKYPGYRLAATGREDFEGGRLELLEQIFDPGSRNRRDRVQPGWRCLEVGAGRGSMAVWLAERVGPSGHVVATDIDLTYLARLQLPNLKPEKDQEHVLCPSIVRSSLRCSVVKVP